MSPSISLSSFLSAFLSCQALFSSTSYAQTVTGKLGNAVRVLNNPQGCRIRRRDGTGPCQGIHSCNLRWKGEGLTLPSTFKVFLQKAALSVCLCSFMSHAVDAKLSDQFISLSYPRRSRTSRWQLHQHACTSGPVHPWRRHPLPGKPARHLSSR